MVFLVADVGGTNTRLALAGHDGLLPASRASYRNEDFASFYDLLQGYLGTQGDIQVQSGCVAIAGPVTSTTARLTNRNWDFDPVQISAMLRCDTVRLINDLAALGYALPHLQGDALVQLRAAGASRRLNGQALVVGAGTGFNVCLTKTKDHGAPIVVEAEAGHSTLSTTVAGLLVQTLGPDAASRFRTLEDCFSGPGLTALYAAVSGGGDRSAQGILSDYGTGKDPAAQKTVDLVATALGLCVLELIHLYLPFQGVLMAGGVARGILGSGALQHFLAGAQAPHAFSAEFHDIPISLIAEDSAALLGCLATLQNSDT